MNEKGFTLPELVVTLSILAIMTTIAIPSYISWLPRHKLQTSVRQIYDDMNLAKMWAVRSNSNAYIIVSPGTERYTVFLDVDGSGTLNAGDTVLKSNVTLENNVNIINTTFNGSTFIFNNRGLAATPALIAGQNDYDVHLTSPSGLYLGVRVNIAGGISTISSTDNGATWSVS